MLVAANQHGSSGWNSIDLLPRLASGLLEKLLRLVDLGRQVRASASIRVVQEHQGPVGFADLLLRDGALAAVLLAIVSCRGWYDGNHCREDGW